MDIEPSSRQWAKSTESRIQMFLDVHLIRSPIANVRASSQRLILSLFKKGNQQQRQRIMSLLQSRCQQLTWMGKASQDFLGLVKNIFSSTDNYSEYKSKIIRKILNILKVVHHNIIINPRYQFYSFASNLIDFGNEQFKPYLLQANGCLNCFGRTQSKSQNFKFQTCVQNSKVFNNKIQYVFKRIYDVKQLSINLKTNSKVKSLTVYYIDKNKEYKKISSNKYKPGDVINSPFLTLQGLMFEFDLNYIGVKKRIQCIFCDQQDDLNCACNNCVRNSDKVDIGGNFRVVGADEALISNQLCQDYQKIQDNINSIKNLHNKMQSKQKISLNFKLDEMVQIYQRIVNNLSLLHQKNPSKLKSKQDQNCFSCNYYQIVNILKFLKQVMKKCDNIPLDGQQISNFKENLRDCLNKNKIQYLKTNLLETLAVFIVNIGKANYKQQFQNPRNKFIADIISKVLIALKQKRNQTQNSIEDQLIQIKQFLQKNARTFKIQEKIKIFTSYFLDWQFLSLVLSNNFNYNVQINRLTLDQLNQLKGYIDFDMSEVFNLNLDSYLKAFLKIVPANIVPVASLDIADSQFLQYVDNKIPEIQKSKIEQAIICCPNPMIKLDMFASLPILIQKLPVKQSIKVMNSLFPFRNAWNLNVIKACSKFDVKLSQLSPEEQINLCLYGYCKSQQYLYIQKIYKLMVPQRASVIIRLQAPISEIENNGVQYPYLPIRQVRSQDLQGDTIKALHDWVYAELGKLNQAMPLDIIVQKNIIDDMNLPIQLVYQNVAENKSKRKLGDKQYDFFKVIYRIQGMFGQPKQRSIGNLRDQKLQTCISYASYFLNKFSEQYSKKIGLDVLIQILQEIKPGLQSDKDKKVILFEILSTLSMNQAICKKIVSDQYGDSIINATVRLMSFQNEKDAKITNFLLTLSSKVIDQANKQMINLRKGSVGQYRKLSGNMDIQQEGGTTESQKKVKFVLQKIKQCQGSFLNYNNVLYSDIAKRLIKLLPFCSKDEPQSTKIIFDYFDLSNWNLKHSQKSLQNLFIFIESLSQSYMTFKSLAAQKGVTNQIMKIITNNIRKQGSTQIDEKKLSQNKNQTQSAFQLLYALVQGDENLQERLFQQKLFQNIYQISLILPQKALQISAGRVPQHCGKIVKYFTDGKIVNHKILQFLKEKRRIEKQKFGPSKNKKFQQMKRKQKNIIDKNVGEKKVQQEDFIVCSTCYQGYKLKKQILGFYIYLSKNQIPLQNNWWKDGRRSPSFTSATYFTPVHFDCHIKAYETSDQKIGRSEWDGALIKNSDVLCNGWIPLKGNKTTLEQFARVERKYFQKNKNGNYWNVVNDLSGLIQRLSNEFDFAKQTKGSSALHNCKLIPILIGFGCHMIQRAGGCNNIEEGVNYLMDHPTTKLTLINYLLSYSIFTQSYQWFEKNKQTFYNWIISYKNEELSQDKRFQVIKPHLLYLKIVEQIFQLIHKPMSQNTANTNLKIFKQLDHYISNNHQQVFTQFQKLSERYKTSYSKVTSIKDIQL